VDNYPLDTIFEGSEEIASSVFDEIVDDNLEALDFLEDAGVAAAFVAGGYEIDEEIVDVRELSSRLVELPTYVLL
jgi:hypothetical protein